MKMNTVQINNKGGKSKKMPPQVKHTLTSKYRMLKANPLLMYELGKKLDSDGVSKKHVVKPLKTLAAAFDADRKESISSSMSNINTCVQSISKIFRGQGEFNNTYRAKNATNVLKAKSLKHEPAHHLNIQLETSKMNLTNHLKKVPVREQLQMNEKMFQKTLNSTSNKSSIKRNDIKNARVAFDEMKSISCSAKKSIAFDDCVDKRRSIFMSNSSPDMAERLSEWLKQKGKNVREYHHLKCFGIHTQNINHIQPSSIVEEKENIMPDLTTSITNDVDTNKSRKSVEKFNLTIIVQDALLDLHKLILEGYPPKQCQVWLKLIKQKHMQVEDEPQYWECRAALEQMKGNINLAVECYKTAIIHGAEIQSIDKYLDQLLHKFSLLNISNDIDLCVNKERCKVVEDARNIFKSSIIQFAVQEKFFKKKNKDGITIEKKLIATPVRRSTRLSRCAYTSTPGVHVYSSLQDVECVLRASLNFQCNNALKDE